MDNMISLGYALVGVAITFLLLKRWTNPLHSIPTIGPSAPLLSYIGAYKYVHHAREMLEEGYAKHQDSVFKVAMPDQWLVVVCGSKLINELRKLPDDQVSFAEATDLLLHSRHTMGPDSVDNPYHITAIRNQLTRNLGVFLPDVVDEIEIAMKTFIPVQGDEWISVHVLSTMAQIVARASSRIFTGLQKCRDTDYLNNAIEYTWEVNESRKVNLFPVALHPFLLRTLKFTQKSVRRAAVHLRPIIEERIKMLDLHGEAWPDKPNDMVMWLIDEARARGRSVDSIVHMVMTVNFAAIHTSSNSMTHALYHLAANPEYLKPLREEVEVATKDGGWTKDSVAALWKLDSFLRESQRINGISGVSLTRKVLQDIVLSDGTRVPAGTLIAAASTATHHNAEKYTDPDVFDPFRFSAMREEGEGSRFQYVNTSVDYIPFGMGAHACPGRFFAASELKAILAYIVLNFDLKFECEGKRPANVWFGQNVVPAPDAKVMFRKRQDGNMYSPVLH